MRHLRAVFAALAVLMLVAGSAGMAFNQRRVASQWRLDSRGKAAALTAAGLAVTEARRHSTDLEARLAALAHESAERSDDAAFLVLQREAARRAAERLMSCGDPSKPDCRAAVVNAASTLNAIATERK